MKMLRDAVHALITHSWCELLNAETTNGPVGMLKSERPKIAASCTRAGGLFASLATERSRAALLGKGFPWEPSVAVPDCRFPLSAS
jgi:hypothetical protein